VLSATVSADGKRLMTGSEDGVVKVWDVDTRQELFGMNTPDQRPVRRLFFTADGRLVANSDEGSPVVFDGRPR